MTLRFLLPAALLLALAACATHPPATTPMSMPATAADELRFSGDIETVNDACLADGVCSLTIAGREVVWMVGWSHDTWGQVSTARVVGAPVDVWCRRTAAGCELRGNPGYYIRSGSSRSTSSRPAGQ